MCFEKKRMDGMIFAHFFLWEKKKRFSFRGISDMIEENFGGKGRFYASAIATCCKK